MIEELPNNPKKQEVASLSQELDSCESSTSCIKITTPLKRADESNKEHNESKIKKGKSRLHKFTFAIAWIILIISLAYYFLEKNEKLENVSFVKKCAYEGSKELISFLSTHLISAMIPAFFLASAISTFFSKQTIILALGENANPIVSYPLAAFAGAILTVCSCGVIPIFMNIYYSGAGIGPAITFLYSSPAINLISLIYTWKILPISMLWARVIGVIVCSISIGAIMAFIFRSNTSEEQQQLSPEQTKNSIRRAWQEGIFFVILVLIMLTSTDALYFITSKLIPPSLISTTDIDLAYRRAALYGKLFLISFEVLILVIILWKWFSWEETRKWLKRTWRQASEIIPMVFLGIFYSGMLGGAPSLLKYLGFMSTNSWFANLFASLAGSIMYFGSIVGVNVVDLFRRWGMHDGPALALLLAGPTISLPSILALIPIVGITKSLAYSVLVAIFSAIAGYLYGSIL